MKCINKKGLCLLFGIFLSFQITGCGDRKIEKEYNMEDGVYSYVSVDASANNVLKPFAQDICVAAENILSDDVDENVLAAAALFDVNKCETLYSDNANERLHPASVTKIMTALIALENGNLEDMITVSKNCEITESGAQLCGFKEGDKITLDQALHGLMMYSGNDAGVAIAEHIAGSVDNFAVMMNEKAKSLGATNTNFVNPHGLTDENHYTTAYDLYLIFNEAVKNEKFVELISKTEFTTSYILSNGSSKEITFNTTNQYLKGDASMPEGVIVVGGKTGTTAAAGSCLILYAKDSVDNPYISVILKAENRSILYTQMSNLLSEINK